MGTGGRTRESGEKIELLLSTLVITTATVCRSTRRDLLLDFLAWLLHLLLLSGCNPTQQQLRFAVACIVVRAFAFAFACAFAFARPRRATGSAHTSASRSIRPVVLPLTTVAVAVTVAMAKRPRQLIGRYSPGMPPPPRHDTSYVALD